MIPQRQPEARKDAVSREDEAHRSPWRTGRPAQALIDLVEDAAVGEVGLLRLLPAAEHLVDGEQLDLRELGGVPRGHGLRSRGR